MTVHVGFILKLNQIKLRISVFVSEVIFPYKLF